MAQFWSDSPRTRGDFDTGLVADIGEGGGQGKRGSLFSERGFEDEGVLRT